MQTQAHAQKTHHCHTQCHTTGWKHTHSYGGYTDGKCVDRCVMLWRSVPGGDSISLSTSKLHQHL